MPAFGQGGAPQPRGHLETPAAAAAPPPFQPGQPIPIENRPQVGRMPSPGIGAAGPGAPIAPFGTQGPQPAAALPPGAHTYRPAGNQPAIAVGPQPVAPAPAAGAPAPYGAPQPNPFAAQQPYANAYGAPQPGAYGAPQPNAYGAPQPGAYGAPQPYPGAYGTVQPGMGWPGGPSPARRAGASAGRRVLLAALAVVLLVGGAFGVYEVVGSNSQSPLLTIPASQAYAKVVGGAIGEKSVHIEVHVTSSESSSGGLSQNQSVTGTGDVGADSGYQEITQGSEHGRTVYTGSTAYVFGNAPFLEDQLGLDPSVAPNYVNQWIELLPSDDMYSTVIDGMTTSTMIDGSLGPTQATLSPSGVSKDPVDGNSVQIALKISSNSAASSVLNMTGTGTLTAQGSSPFLPRQMSATVNISATGPNGSASSSVNVAESFSNWGETVHLPATPNPVMYSTISGANGGGGSSITGSSGSSTA